MEKFASLQCFACIRHGFNQDLACVGTVFRKIETMRELYVRPCVIGLEKLWSEMQDPRVICGDFGFEDADCRQVEEGAVEHAGDIKSA